jgi:elongation factor P
MFANSLNNIRPTFTLQFSIEPGRLYTLVMFMERAIKGAGQSTAYRFNQGFHFMDPETYETVTLDEKLLVEAKDYLVENLRVEVLYVEGKAAQVEVPASVTLKVTESAEGVRGDSANNVMKTATLETGLVVNVPLFIKEGETVKVDTRTGTYMGRA